MIIIVGDKPSKNNVDPQVALVGTPSYRRLLEWIGLLDIDISETVLCNRDDIRTHFSNLIGFRDSVVVTKKFRKLITEDDKVIALGEEAAASLSRAGIGHFRLPHPSPRNRMLNDQAKVNIILEECRVWLKLIEKEADSDEDILNKLAHGGNHE